MWIGHTFSYMKYANKIDLFIPVQDDLEREGFSFYVSSKRAREGAREIPTCHVIFPELALIDTPLLSYCQGLIMISIFHV